MEYARKKKSKNERGNCFSETASWD
jgi:hypothetical protein